VRGGVDAIAHLGVEGGLGVGMRFWSRSVG